MYYHTPHITPYVAWLRRHRLKVILFYAVLATLALVLVRPQIAVSDTQIWLGESRQMQRNEAQQLEPTYVSRLVVRLKHFDETGKAELAQLQQRLENEPALSHVESLFSAHFIYNHQETRDSSLVKALPIGELDARQMQEFVRGFGAPYRPFVNDAFTAFTFYLYSPEPFVPDAQTIRLEHELLGIEAMPGIGGYLPYAALVLAVIVVLFRLLFRNFISILAGLAVVSTTLLLTFALIALVYADAAVPIAMALIVIAIALVDYLYFYYRWHVSQYCTDLNRALNKMINRNLHPAFWTSFITILGLGSLLLVDSQVIKALSLSVIGASTVAYLLNVTLLPALLSFFHIQHPKVSFGRFGYYFANREIHYNKTYLAVFLALTSVLITVGAYEFYYTKEKLFANVVHQDVIVVETPYIEINQKKLQQLFELERELKRDNPGIARVESVATVLRRLNRANTQSEVCNAQNLSESLFFLELYDLENDLFDGRTVKIRITLDGADKHSVVRWLQSYDGMQLFLTDVGTLLGDVKINQTLILGGSLSVALLIIGIIMGFIFQNAKMAMVGFTVNAIPIAWFGLIATLFNIPLGIEVLIAMTVTVGLASDATVHFAYKYLRSRYFRRTQKHSLEIMFFYAGVPVIIGSLVLAAVFALLSLTQIESLRMIGGYGAILMLMSLLTDLFILPVMMLAIDGKTPLRQCAKAS